jgi:hypothetical protein
MGRIDMRRLRLLRELRDRETVTAVAGVVFLDERITWNVVAGGLIVLLGLAYAKNRLPVRRAQVPRARSAGGPRPE